MVLIFTALSHLVLLVAAVGMILLILNVILGSFSSELDFGQEMFMRGLAAALIYVGARAVGLSVPELMFKALSTPFPVAVGLAGVVLPALVGFIVAWYVIGQLNSNDARQNAIAMRILAMIIVFVFFLYCDSYVASFSSESSSTFVHLLPNLSFVLSILLYAIFRFHPIPDAEQSGPWNRRQPKK